MTIYAGIWMDLSEAVIVRVTATGEEILAFRSHAHAPGRAADEHQPAEAVMGTPRASVGEVNRFYQRVFEAIRDAQGVLLGGPGAAKGELRRWCQQGQYAGRIQVLEANDKWTSTEMVAKVREQFMDLATVPPSYPHSLPLQELS